MFVINFLLSLVFYLLMVTIASHAIDALHSPTSMAGLVAGIFIIGSLVGRLVTGRMIEDVGSKRMLIAGITLNLITSALYLGVFNLPLLLINRFIHGIVSGIGSTTSATIIAQIIPGNRRGEGISFYTMSLITATALGPFAGILISRHANYEIIFICNLVLVAVSLLLALTLDIPSRKSLRQVRENIAKRCRISNYFEPTAVPIAMVSLIIAFCYSGILTFISYYAEQINLVKAASFYFFVYAVTVLVSRPFSGRLLDAKGANIVVYPCLFLFSIGMFLLSQASHGITLLLAGSIIGLGYGNYQSAGQAIAIKASPPHKFGLATSTYMIFFDLGLGVGPYIFGFFVPFTGCRGLYSILAAVILADIVIYHFLQGRKVNRYPNPQSLI